MKPPDNITHRGLVFVMEDGRPLYLLAINRANWGPAPQVLNTAIFSLQQPPVEHSREEKEAALFQCLFHVLLTTKTQSGDPPDKASVFEEVSVLDMLCPHRTETSMTMRFRANGKGGSYPIAHQRKT